MKYKLIYDASHIGMCVSKRDEKRTGIFWTAYNLLKAFSKSNYFDIVLYCPREYSRELYRLLLKKDFINLEYDCDSNLVEMANKSDAFFSPFQEIPVELERHPIAKFQMLYDVIPLVIDYPGNEKGSFIRKVVNKLFFETTYFIDSVSAKKDFLKFNCYADEKNFHVTYLGCNEKICYECDESKILDTKLKYGIPLHSDYILSFCTIEPRKNIERIIRTFVEFICKNKVCDINLVIAGSQSWGNYSEIIKKQILSYPEDIRKKIVLIGYVDDRDVSSIYSGSQQFVFTSQYEGFGLPVLEAMRCGRPVICSNNSSLPEVIGDCGLCIDWNSDKAHIGAYEKLYYDKNLREQLGHAAIKRSKQFTWERTVQKMSQVITNRIEQKNVVDIVYITSDSYVIPTAASIQSLVYNKKESTTYNINIITYHVDDNDIELFNEFNNDRVKINIIKYYDEKHELDKYAVDGYYVSPACMLKFNLSQILSKTKKVIYLDGDLLIRCDLSDLFNQDLGNSYVAAVKDFHASVDLGFCSRVGVDQYFNAGVMVMNLELFRRDDLTPKLYKLKDENPNFLCMDQDVYNLLLNNKVKWLSPRYNLQFFNFSVKNHSIEDVNKFYNTDYSTLEELENQSIIIHLTNYLKPWNTSEAPFFEEWRSYYLNSPFKTKFVESIYQSKKEKRYPLFINNIFIEKDNRIKEVNLNIIRVIKTNSIKKICLFSFPFIRKTYHHSSKKVYLFGIQAIKKIKHNQMTQYYFLGLPIYKRISSRMGSKKYMFGLCYFNSVDNFTKLRYIRDESKLNLLVDARVLSYASNKDCSRSGVFFVVYNLIKLLTTNPRVNLGLICDNANQKDTILSVISRDFKCSFNNIFPFYCLDNIINLADYYLSPLNAIPECVRSSKARASVIFYDIDPVIHSENFPDSGDKDFWFRTLIKSIDDKTLIFAISEYTRSDLLKYLPSINPDNVVLDLLAADPCFRRCSFEEINESRRKYSIPDSKKYVFSLCNLQPRKNLIRIIRTFLSFVTTHDIDDLIFVMGGASWSTFEKQFSEISSSPEFRKYVLKIGYVDDKDLAPLYSGALFFVYTSSFEGFGLPPLEAMQCGCPVITSNSTSLPEVVGDAGIMINWDNDDEHVNAYKTLYFDNSLRSKLGEKAYKRSKYFSWNKFISVLIDSMNERK